jgi:hypothetical protein
VGHVPGLAVTVVAEEVDLAGEVGIQVDVTMLSLERRLVGPMPLPQTRPLTLKQT